MNIIDQLEETVTPAVLGTNSSVAHVSLLEQFYAILVTRLTVPEVYTQLQRTSASPIEATVASSSLFEQLWQQPRQRHLLIQELATTHHIDEVSTEQLVINAAQLAYQELKNLANGQFLPAFLQVQQPAVRQYLPVWAAAVVSPEVAVVAEEAAMAADALIYDNSPVANAAVPAEQALAANGVPVIVAATDGQVPIDQVPIDSAIHANPSAYRTAESQGEVRRRNQRNDLLIRLLLLAGALAAIMLIWAFVIKPNEVEPIEPVVIAPVVTTPETVEPPKILTPAQLVVGVDDSGNLYSCSATVGDVNLQGSLRQALTATFGSDQASICDLTVEEGVATTLAGMNIETLPNILNVLRSAPFARLHLQNDSISLEAPDDMLLQRLLVDVRTLVPTVTITTAAPLAIVQPPANTYDDTYNNNGNYNNNPDMSYNGSAPITSNNNVITNQPNQMPPANNIANEVAPPPQPPQSSPNNNVNNNANNNSNNMSQNNPPPGPISEADVERMANTTIVSEPAQGGRPIE